MFINSGVFVIFLLDKVGCHLSGVLLFATVYLDLGLRQVNVRDINRGIVRIDYLGLWYV